jgi:hypothetical protein
LIPIISSFNKDKRAEGGEGRIKKEEGLHFAKKS